MKKILFCLLSGAVFAFSSCQSDEPTANSGTIKFGGRAVDFAVSGAAPAVRTHYGENGTVNWSHNDRIYVYSHYTDAAEDNHQHAHYTIGENGGSSTGNFTYAITGTLANPIYWYDEAAGKQHFMAYYPAESVGANPASGGGCIDFDTYTGVARLHVPANQSAMARVDPQDQNHANPLSYAIASTKSVDISEESIVDLKFHDIMNVLRVHINNPYDQVVMGVKVTALRDQMPLSGTAIVTPPSHEASNGEPADDIDFGAIVFDERDIDGITPSGNEVSAVESAPSVLADLYYDLYLLPQTYDGGDLQVTVMIGNDNSSDNDVVRTIPSSIDQSAMKSVRINVPQEVGNRSYMGEVDGNPLYIATGNLIAEYSSAPIRGSNTPPKSYYIAGTVPGKSRYLPHNVTSTYPFLSLARGHFKTGIINDDNYWKENSIPPSAGDYTSANMDFSGDAALDLVKYGLSGTTWRTPKSSELSQIVNTDIYDCMYCIDYKGVYDLRGWLISTIPGVTPGVDKDSPSSSIFLPLVGILNISSSEIAMDATYCTYATSTIQDATDIRVLDVMSSGIQMSATERSVMCALRPVSNVAQEPMLANFGDWVIQKDDTSDTEETLMED